MLLYECYRICYRKHPSFRGFPLPLIDSDALFISVLNLYCHRALGDIVRFLCANVLKSKPLTECMYMCM